MSRRLISKDELVKRKWYVQYHPYNEDGSAKSTEEIVEEVIAECKQIVENAPEVEPVVHCKDCAKKSYGKDGELLCRMGDGVYRRTRPYGYCAWGYDSTEDETGYGGAR